MAASEKCASVLADSLRSGSELIVLRKEIQRMAPWLMGRVLELVRLVDSAYGNEHRERALKEAQQRETS